MNTEKSPESTAKSARLVWIVGAIFAVQIAVWTAWITFASKHKVAEVPLLEAAGAKRLAISDKLKAKPK